MIKLDIGKRLKEERDRLGLSQQKLSEATGATTRTHIAWEKGEQSPNAAYLATMDSVGIDVGYVITGKQTINEHNLQQELNNFSIAWEAIVSALQEANKVLPADQIRRAAEALYRAVKEGEGAAQPLAKMMADAA